jgi:LysR family nitrogen assimilation transcriptional regulator
MLDLKQLRTFSEIAECGSFSKAAERLHIAQPALTRQIHLLETDLNTRLLDRHSRGVDLTEEGRDFLVRARTILRDAERTLEEFRARSGTISGPVALAIAPAMVDFFLGSVIGTYTRDYPEVKIEIVEGFTGYIEEWLIDGRVDLAILYDPRPDKRLRRETLVREKLFVIGPPQMGLRTDQPKLLSDLESENLITASRDQRLREVIEEAAEKSGTDLSVVFEANSLNVHKTLVLEGLGISILPYGAVSKEVAAGTLSAAPLVQPEISWDVTLAIPTLSRPSIAARVLADTIRDAVTALTAEDEWPGQA